MSQKFEATDSKGRVHKRGSKVRTYTHCVVIHYKGAEADDYWPARLAYSRAEWAGSLALAEKNAAFWRGKHRVEGVEIIEASPVKGKAR